VTSAVSSTKTQTDLLEEATEEAIKAYDGNPRQAVRALLEVNAELEEKLGRAAKAVSFGYSRGYHMRMVVEQDDPST
jgi:hypothetical protein